jgi:hypothetical protein
VVHELVKSSALALGQRWRPAHQERTQAQEALARRQERRRAEQASREATGRASHSRSSPSVSWTQRPRPLPRSPASTRRLWRAAQRWPSLISCRPVTRPCPQSASSCWLGQPSSISGGTVSSRPWHPFASRPDGSRGCTRASPQGLLGPPGASHAGPPTASQAPRGLGSSAGGV